MPRHSIDPLASEEQKRNLATFLGHYGVDRTDFPERTKRPERCCIHTTLSPQERREFQQLCFNMGTYPSSVLRALARSTLRKMKADARSNGQR